MRVQLIIILIGALSLASCKVDKVDSLQPIPDSLTEYMTRDAYSING